VIDLFAHWCVPCQQMLPVIEEISGEYEVPFYKVDIDKVPEAKEFTGAKAVPMIIIYKDGRKKEFLFGINSKEAVQKKLERVLKFANL
jgi:thioredoxin-like negative regulator of GroEL